MRWYAIALCLLIAPSAWALDNPVYTTGDFRCYADAQIDGALALGDNVTLTGDLAVSGAISCADLTATGDASVADSLYVGGNLVVAGELAGARASFLGGRGAAQTADCYMATGGFTTSATAGIVAPHDGRVVSVTACFNVSSHTDGATIAAYVMNEGTPLATCTATSATINDNGVFAPTATVARADADTFSAGDILAPYADLTGTATFTCNITFEVQYDD